MERYCGLTRMLRPGSLCPLCRYTPVQPGNAQRDGGLQGSLASTADPHPDLGGPNVTLQGDMDTAFPPSLPHLHVGSALRLPQKYCKQCGARLGQRQFCVQCGARAGGAGAGAGHGAAELRVVI